MGIHGLDVLIGVVDDPVVSKDPEKQSHIVRAQPGMSGTALVLEARVLGIPVEALCGYSWVPSKDPSNLPICTACKEVYDLYGVLGGGFTPLPDQ